MVWKIVLLGLLCLVYGSIAGLLMDMASPVQAEFASKQLDGVSFQHVQLVNKMVMGSYLLGWIVVAFIGFLMFKSNLSGLYVNLTHKQ